MGKGWEGAQRQILGYHTPQNIIKTKKYSHVNFHSDCEFEIFEKGLTGPI